MKKFLLAFVILSFTLTAGVLKFDHYYPYEEVVQAVKKLKSTYPEFVSIKVIGKSTEGRDIWLIKINNPKTGDEFSKPAMYVEGNIHGNEIQGGETCLYLADYLLSNYGKIKKVRELVDRVVFYIVPVLNVDGRYHFFHDPATPDDFRGISVKKDDDGDGLVDEDPSEDLDGDGNIVMMVKKVKGGRFVFDKEDPRILRPAKPDEIGEYQIIGDEGIDNDGDGLFNEDGYGYYDPNRSWGFNWQPPYVQMGAGKYPFDIPETRAVAEFLKTHPNIMGFQDFHNFGGWILRGPGAPNVRYHYADVKVYDYIGNIGEKILPGYKYVVSWKGLYTTYGASDDFAYGTFGIFSFTNEEWKLQQDFNGDGKVSDKERMMWNDYILNGANFVNWHKFNHPQLGEILLGGWKKFSRRLPPVFMLPELIHRNAEFVIFHASQLPDVKIDEVKVEKLKNKIFRVTATIMNEAAIPTRSSWPVTKKIGRPDYAKIEGVKVITGGILQSPFNSSQLKVQEKLPWKIWIDQVPGKGAVRVQWLVEGKGKAKITFNSQKGGKLTKEIEIK
ncbi:MAG: hypothetical protein J7L62_06120 [Candidatus Aminicenantes bacterium]|nr:hypothetical protein [Candidatus Aminicenantes bacterium]